MLKEKLPEVWMRGPVQDVPALLQPVAHALLQAREEVIEMMIDFPESFLWNKPAGVASAGFHLQHLSGVINRLLTYARAETLTEDQLALLAKEGKPDESIRARDLLNIFSRQVDDAVTQLRNTAEQSFTEVRGIGRKQIPTTVLGLLFHAAEHTMRHTGQLYVTIQVIKNGNINP